MRSPACRLPMAAALILLASLGLAQKKPLDHSVYDGWKSIPQSLLSPDGRCAAWVINPQEGDGQGFFLDIQKQKTLAFDRLSGLRFTSDSQWLIATMNPPLAEVKAAARAAEARTGGAGRPAASRRGPRPEGQPGGETAPSGPSSSLVIIRTETGRSETIAKVQSWTLPAKGSGWLVYRPASGASRPSAGPSELPEGTPPLEEALGGDPSAMGAVDQEPPAQEPPSQEEKKEAGTKKKADHPAGSLHVLRRLETGAEIRIENLSGYVFSRNGKSLLAAVSTKDGSGDGIFLYDLTKEDPKPEALMTGLGRYVGLALDKEGRQYAFATDRDDYASKTPSLALYTGTKGRRPEKADTEGVKKGYELSASGAFRFTPSGRRLIFPARVKPVEQPPLPPESERVSLDVWSWKDSAIQLTQLKRAAAEKARTFDCLLDLSSGRTVQIEDQDRKSVQASDRGDGDVGLFIDSQPYERQSTWGDGRTDAWLIDLKTGVGRLIFKGLRGRIELSPKGRWAAGWDSASRAVFAVSVKTGEKTDLAKGLPGLFDELFDLPGDPPAYGFTGWMEGEDRILVNDRWDIWSVDPSGRAAPSCVTRGAGRGLQTQFRIQRTDLEKTHFAPGEKVIFSGAGERGKDVGLYHGDLTGRQTPRLLAGGPQIVTVTAKAENADRFLFTKQTFEVYPDLWTSDSTFAKAERLTDANPQQKDYLWGTSELVSYTSNDGVPLQGVLVKPGGFDSSKEYPMIVYFYERSSDLLYRYRSPAPSASTINPSMFASCGYVVFMPDIPYKVGYPGESAMSAILPGVQKVLSMGFVDPKRIGIQGQSWGGYEVGYLVTRTNMFAAAGAGAPVSNMFSAYSGVRYGTGVLRQMQYEAGQSRIGGTPWEMPLRFLENSPVFFADKVQTPLLIMSNDQDGAVPWTEGIQYYAALRRLDRPVWLLSYNGEDHNLVQRKNRKDYSIRLQQFFDHYLKGAPMPVWMADGIPAVDKGRNMGLDLKQPSATAKP